MVVEPDGIQRVRRNERPNVFVPSSSETGQCRVFDQKSVCRAHAIGARIVWRRPKGFPILTDASARVVLRIARGRATLAASRDRS
jgi:hypothetical protein